MSFKLAEGADIYRNRNGYEPVLLDDIDKLIPSYDLNILISASRKLFTNADIPRAALLQKADFSVGCAWEPTFMGKDKEWGNDMTQYLKEVFYPSMDTRGEAFDWHTTVNIYSICYDRNGGFLAIKTTGEDKEQPKVLYIPIWRLNNGPDQNNGKIQNGRFRGKIIKNGVIHNVRGKVVGYRYLVPDKDGVISTKTLDISTQFACHFYNPEHFDSYRGYPSLISSLNGLKDAKQSHEWELIAQKAVSAISIMEWNQSGMAEEDDTANRLLDIPNNSEGLKLVETEIDGGGIVRHFHSDSGDRMDQLKHDRPGDMWESLQDRIVRGTLTALGWPYSFVWKNEVRNGTAQRQDQLMARASVAKRTKQIEKPARYITNFGVSKAIEAKVFPETDDWYKWSFTKPPKISIDPSRDTQSFIDEWTIGTASHTERAEEKGMTIEDIYRLNAREALLRKRIAKEESERDGEFEVDESDISQNMNQSAPPVS